jgi:tape measure domain-containing protein
VPPINPSPHLIKRRVRHFVAGEFTVPDSIIRAQLQAVGGDQMLAVLRMVRQEVVAVGQSRARVTVDADTQAARQQIAEIRNQTAELRAARAGITITADTSGAQRSIQAINLETQKYAALTARAKLDVDTSAAERKIDGLSGKITTALLQGAGQAIGFEITRGLGAAADAVVGYTGRLEQARVAYTGLLGSAQAADRFIAQQQAFAKSTPFDLSQVQRDSQLLLATGVAARDIIPDLNAVGNAVAAIGGGGETLDRVVLALSQMRNSVHLNAQDMNQLIQAGIPAWDILAEHIGKTQAQARQLAESGQLSGADAAASILDALSQRNVGLMQQQSKTFLGRLENFEDTFRQDLSRVGRPLFDELSAGLEKAGDALASPKFQEFAGDMVHDLTTVVHAGEELATALGKVPTPVIEAGLHIAELAVAVKAAESAFGLVQKVIAPTISLLTGETAAHARNTAAIEAETAATTQLTAAKGRMGAASLAGGGGLGKAAGVGIAGAGALGSAAIMVAVGEGLDELGHVVPDLIHKQFADAAKELLLHEPGTPWGLAAFVRDGIKALTGTDLKQSLFGAPGINALVQQPAATSAAIGNGDALPGPLRGIAEGGGGAVVAQLLAQVASGAMTADQARASFDRLDATFGSVLHTSDALRKQFRDGLTPAINAYADSIGDAADATAKAYGEMEKATRALAAGASPEDILRAFYGVTDAGTPASPQQQSAAQAAIAPLIAAQDAQQQDALDRAKQFGQDLKQATQEASQAIGSVDLSKGFQSIADAAPGLDRAREALAQLGQQSGALNALAAMADEWKAITDAEDKATAAFKSYMGLFSEGDQRIQQIKAYAQSFQDAADAYQKAQAHGQRLTPEEQRVIADNPAVQANANALVNQVRTQQAPSLLSAGAQFPNLPQGYQDILDLARQQGGAPNIALGVKADTEQAQREIQSFLDTPRQMFVKVALDTTGLPAWAVSFLNRAGGGGADGFTTAAGRDLSRFIGGQGGPGAGNAADVRRFGVTPDGGGLGYRPLSASQYGQIVPSGPLANPQVYAALMAAAQQYNVDPRALLAFIKNEGVAPALAAVNNYGGIKGKGGPVSTEGDTYAAYSSPRAFFEALAANLTTGAYAGDYQSGNLAAIRQRYVAGSAPPSSAQQANIGNTVDYYNQLTQQYPAGGATDSAVQGTVNTVRQQIVAKAMQSLDTDHLAEYCKQFVEETVEAITGRRGATGQREQTAASALQSALGQGLGISKAQAQPGDLVYYGGTAGNPAGHVAIYMGNGQQISTEDVGGSKVHIEGILPGAQFVRVPGLPDFAPGGGVPGGVPPSGNNRAPDGRFDPSKTDTLNIRDPNTDAARRAAAANREEMRAYQESVLAAKAATADLNTALSGISGKDMSGVIGQARTMLDYFTKIEQAKLPDNADEVQKQTALNDAFARSVSYAQAYAQLLTDVENKTGDLAADTQKVADIVGGPLANAYAQAAVASAQMTAAEAETTRLTREHDATVKRRAADDQAASRAQTMAGWAQQDAAAAMQRRQQAAQDALADRTTAENARYTGVSRSEQDRSRALQFSQQLQGTDLQNQLVDLQKNQQSTVYQRTAAEQVEEGQARTAGTNQQAAPLQAELAAMHDRDLKQKDADTKAIDDIQARIRLQQRSAALDSYNLESETIRETRKHEDIMAGLAAQSAAQQRTFAREQQAEQEHQQAIARSAQLQQWQEQDKRQAEDAAYQAAIDAQSRIKEDAQASLDAAQQAIQVWQQTGQVIASAANGAASSMQSLLQATQIPEGSGAIRRLGGMAAGGTLLPGESTIVGDAPGGIPTPYTEQVTNRGGAVT